MGNEFWDTYVGVKDARLRQQAAREQVRQFGLEQSIRDRELALREAAEKRAAQDAEWNQFGGPAAGLAKTPYGGVAATDIGTVSDLFRRRNTPVEPELGPDVQGPPTLDMQSGRDYALSAARAGIEDKVRSMLDLRYLRPTEVRAGASMYGADRSADSRVQAAQITAAGQGARTTDKDTRKQATAWRTTADKYSPYLQRTSTSLGMSSGLRARLREAQALPESVDWKLTTQEVRELWTAIARNIGSSSGGGQVAHSLIKELSPSTAAMDIASQLQWASNIPQDAHAEEFTKRAMKILARQDAAAQANIHEAMSYMLNAHRGDFLAGGDEARTFLRDSAGFTDEELAPIFGQAGGGGGGAAKVMITVPAQGWTDTATGKFYPPGTQFPVDPDEVPMAEREGWSRVMAPGVR